ncbi:YbaY family lipoprotein [Ferrovibrio sp. MS7]|uniref:YbaY family lipoprotein n=1 Tax=Ferrovibrio plantarum TaxID=3119164 RepID=UPI003135B515
MTVVQTIAKNINNHPRPSRRTTLALVGLIAAMPLAACASGPQESVSGTIATRQSMVLPADSVLVVRLLDATRGDMAAYTVTEQRIAAAPLPAHFDLRYYFGTINPNGTYYVQAQVEQAGRLLLINDQNYSVITRNSPYRNVQVTLVPAAGTVLVPNAAAPVAATPTAVIQNSPTVTVAPATTTVIVPGGVYVTPR